MTHKLCDPACRASQNQSRRLLRLRAQPRIASRTLAAKPSTRLQLRIGPHASSESVMQIVMHEEAGE